MGRILFVINNIDTPGTTSTQVTSLCCAIRVAILISTYPVPATDIFMLDANKSNMIHPFQRANIMTIQHNLPLKLIPVLLNVVVLDHYDNHVYLREELVEVKNLILNYFLLCKEGVEGLERTGEVALLDVEHLESGALTDIINILLVSEAVEADTAIVCDVVLLHYLMDALKDENRLVIVGFHRFINDLGELWIVPHQEPWINADTVTSNTRTRLKDIHTGVHVADADDLVNVHIVVAANPRQLVGKCDIHGPIGVLDNLGHLGRADVGHNNLALAE